MSVPIEEIKQRHARSYSDFPKYQQFAHALKDIGVLLAEIQKLTQWRQGLEATALRWANESNDLRKELEAAIASAKDDLISRRGVVERLRSLAESAVNHGTSGYFKNKINALADEFAVEDSGEMRTTAPSLSESRVAQDILLKAARNIDWGQVVLNGGPPCFALNTPHDLPDRFCGRSERWDGHGVIHNYVSLADLLCPHLYLEFAGASVGKCLDCSAFIPLASRSLNPLLPLRSFPHAQGCSASMTDFPESRTSSAFCDGCGYEQPRNPITQVTSGLPSEQLPDASSLQPSPESESSVLPEPQRRTGEHVHCWHERSEASSLCCHCEDLYGALHLPEGGRGQQKFACTECHYVFTETEIAAEDKNAWGHPCHGVDDPPGTVCESFRQPFPVLALPEGGEQEYAPCPDERCNDTEFPIPQCVTAVLWAEQYDEAVEVLRETAKRFDGIDSGTCKTCTGGFRLYDIKGNPQACDNKDCLSHRITAILNYTRATVPVVEEKTNERS